MAKMGKERNFGVLLVMGVLLMLIGGTTYAYFVAQGWASTNSSVRVQISTTDNLSFSVGSQVSFTAD